MVILEKSHLARLHWKKDGHSQADACRPLLVTSTPVASAIFNTWQQLRVHRKSPRAWQRPRASGFLLEWNVNEELWL